MRSRVQSPECPIDSWFPFYYSQASLSNIPCRFHASRCLWFPEPLPSDIRPPALGCSTLFSHSALVSSFTVADELGAVLSTRCRDRAVRRSRIPVSDADVFRQVVTNFVMSTIPMSTAQTTQQGERTPMATPQIHPGLKKIHPYWYPYTTMAKGRWLGREILEVVSTEFRDRSMEFYVSPRLCRRPSGRSLNAACAVRVLRRHYLQQFTLSMDLQRSTGMLVREPREVRGSPMLH